jgi:hypothetical protein
MSLKNFHIVFVTLSTLLALGCAYGAWTAYSTYDGAANLALTIVSLLAGVALVVYGVWFWKKAKKLIL